jgi:glycerol-3-phosphate cytidylyltransferase
MRSGNVQIAVIPGKMEKLKMINIQRDRGYVGFTCSAFDLLHAGHQLMLEEAKGVCDYLIVALQYDPSLDRPTKNKPVQSVVERYLQLRSSRWVDEIVFYNSEKELEELLKVLPIDIRILGDEYRNRDFTGKQLCQDLGIQLHYNSRTHDYSSSALRKRVAAAESRQEPLFQNDVLTPI